MNQLKTVVIFLFTMTILSFTACKKPEGEGGTGRIKGTLLAEQWNATFTVKQAEFLAMDEWVYIIYGKARSSCRAEVKNPHSASAPSHPH